MGGGRLLRACVAGVRKGRGRELGRETFQRLPRAAQTLTWRARNIFINFIRYLWFKEKTDYTSSICQKYLMGEGKHTENKEIYPSFKKSGDSGFMKRQRNLSLITSQLILN